VLPSAVMPLAYQIVLIVHVACAASWFGGTLFLPRRVRDALSLGADGGRVAIAGLQHEGRVLRVASTLVFLTGMGLVFLRFGGFAGLPVRFHISLLLTLIWLGLDHAVTGRALKTLSPTATPAEAKRLTGVVGAQHLLFTTTLVLMLWRV